MCEGTDLPFPVNDGDPCDGLICTAAECCEAGKERSFTCGCYVGAAYDYGILEWRCGYFYFGEDDKADDKANEHMRRPPTWHVKLDQVHPTFRVPRCLSSLED